MKWQLWIASPILLGLCVCGSKPDPFDEVRKYRRQYEQSFDWSISNETKELIYEISVQNKAGTLKLQDLTLIVEALDEQKNPIWKKTLTLDVSQIGKHGSKSYQFRQKIDRAQEVQYFNVSLAPDHDGTDFMNYKEFARAAH